LFLDYLSPVLFLFFFERSGDHRDLHSFPTRRSSDLWQPVTGICQPYDKESLFRCFGRNGFHHCITVVLNCEHSDIELRQCRIIRSEEHTSELQSRENLVCRLLLEKKKNKVDAKESHE